MQLPGILDWVRIGLARRAVVGALAPFMPRFMPGGGQQEGGTAPLSWRAPYRLGYLATAVTLIAEHVSPGLDEAGMGKVQEDAFAVLTGEMTGDIGERICYLSAMPDAEFVAGSGNAVKFVRALHEKTLRHQASGEADMPMDRTELKALWLAYVDRDSALPPPG